MEDDSSFQLNWIISFFKVCNQLEFNFPSPAALLDLKRED